ncbi:MAG: DUF1318 domain-containing protein [Desulfuromonadales bacterium]|nr:DUF1318 domain-containing protein [Desulfuromonadales bacterium]
MRCLLRSLSLLAAGVVISCVTINIYFPAEEIRGAADRIVDDVYGEKDRPVKQAPDRPDSSFIPGWGPGLAHAAQDIDISTPEIRAIRAGMKDRFAQFVPYLDSGHLGIALDGSLLVRSLDGLDLKERAELNRLVTAENLDRQRLYQEIARANGFPERADEIQTIFAESWRDKAGKGWYLQNAGGGWQRK